MNNRFIRDVGNEYEYNHVLVLGSVAVPLKVIGAVSAVVYMLGVIGVAIGGAVAGWWLASTAVLIVLVGFIGLMVVALVGPMLVGGIYALVTWIIDETRAVNGGKS